MLSERDRSLSAFVSEAASHVFTVDNRLWRTLRALPRPGVLTAEYVAGRRRPYLSPVQIFVVLTVAFFLVGPDLGLMNVRLAQFETGSIMSSLAGPIVDAGMQRTGLDHAAYTTRIERTMDGQKRLLFLLAIPVFALVLKALYRRRSYVEHAVFATHALASILVFIFLYLVALFITVAFILFPVMTALGIERSWPPGQLEAIVAVATPVLLFLYVALRRVYGEGRPATALKAAAATIGLSSSLVVYQYLLFLTSAALLHLRG
jgi:hypothetical protein